MTDPTKVTPIRQADARFVLDTRVAAVEYLHKHGISGAQASREIGPGVSDGTLSAWLRDAYPGDNAAVAQRVHTWLETRLDLEARSIAEAGLDRHVDLDVYREISSVLSHAQATGDIVLVHGRSGIGKSWAARLHCAARSGASLVRMTAVIRSAASMLSRVGAEVGAGARHPSAAAAEEAVIARLAGRRALLAVDEAHHLRVAELDELRCIRDVAGCGLALIGDDGLWGRLAGNPRCGQIVGRIGFRLPLGDPAAGDVAALAESVIGRPPSAKELRGLLDAAAGYGGLHALRGLLARAWIIAREGGADTIRARDLAAAQEAA